MVSGAQGDPIPLFGPRKHTSAVNGTNMELENAAARAEAYARQAKAITDTCKKGPREALQMYKQEVEDTKSFEIEPRNDADR